eukprot:7021110-Pyramimonas_sp.AAC.1
MDAAPDDLEVLYTAAPENNERGGPPAPFGFKGPLPRDSQLQCSILDGQDGARTILKHASFKSPAKM